MKKKLFLILGIVVLLIAALVFVIDHKNNNKLSSENNPYGTEDLRQSTIDQIGNPLYGDIILPDELEKKLEEKEDVTVYFYSPECVHCINTTPTLVPLAEEMGVDVVKYNLLEFTQGWEKYEISGTPTLIHFEKGVEKDRLTGSQSEEVFRAFFDSNVLGDGEDEEDAVEINF